MKLGTQLRWLILLAVLVAGLGLGVGRVRADIYCPSGNCPTSLHDYAKIVKCEDKGYSYCIQTLQEPNPTANCGGYSSGSPPSYKCSIGG